jgi:alpha-tubulin suppressor-like RCC1 family protein
VNGHLYQIKLEIDLSIERIVIEDFNDIIVEQVVTASYHYIIIDQEGTCFAWGYNNYSQCGIVEEDGLTFPRIIDKPTSIDILRDDIPIQTAACGASHTLLLSKDGDVYAMGNNKFGQCGINDVEIQLQPTLIEQDSNLESIEQVKQIACGSHHSVILSHERALCCGANKYGQISTLETGTCSFTPLKERISNISTGLLWNTFVSII